MADQWRDPRQAPGWKKDPYTRFYARYWDGERWTEHVASVDRVQAIDPIPAPPPVEAPPPPPPRPTPTGYVPPPKALARPVRTQEARPAANRKRRRIPLWVKIATPLVVIIGIAASSSDDKKDTPVAATGDTSPAEERPTAPPATTKPSTKSSNAVGDTARTSDFDITVFGFKNPASTTNPFDKAKAGMHYVAVDVQVANRGTKQQSFSSLLGFHLVDGANRQYDMVITTITPGPPDGEIPAGEAIRGFAVFEVPDGSTGLRLRVQGSITASGAFFTLA